MYPNAKLAWIHFDNIYSKKGVTVQSYHSTVEKMYKRAIRYETISNLNEEMAQNHMKKYGQSRYYLPLINVIDTFGREYLVKDQ